MSDGEKKEGREERKSDGSKKDIISSPMDNCYCCQPPLFHLPQVHSYGWTEWHVLSPDLVVAEVISEMSTGSS